MTRLKDALAALGGTSERLSRVSVRAYQNPYTAVDWRAALEPAGEWFSSPELAPHRASATAQPLSDPPVPQPGRRGRRV